MPCTLGHRFYLRDGALHMHTGMRSQDLWLGFPYDVFTNTTLRELLAGWLDVAIGEYHHHVDSLHLYDHNHVDAAALSEPSASPRMLDLRTDWASLPDLLDGVIAGTPSATVGPGWREFARVLASYRAWTGGDRTNATDLARYGDGPLLDALRRWYAHLRARSARSSA